MLMMMKIRSVMTAHAQTRCIINFLRECRLYLCDSVSVPPQSHAYTHAGQSCAFVT